MIHIGIELGIYADSAAVFKAAKIAQQKNVNFFVPETHPKKFGVDAFETILSLRDVIKKGTVGTAVVNVFSRDKERMLEYANKIQQMYANRFLLGIGTSAPIIVEQLYGKKFAKPVKRMIEYTEYLRNHGYSGKLFWAAVGDAMIKLSVRHADGVIFFMRTKEEIKRAASLAHSSIKSDNKKSFQVSCIIPVYISDSLSHARSNAKATIAKYIGANEFYSNPLRMAGYKGEVEKIRESYFGGGLDHAIKQVTDQMADDLTIQGTPKECAKQLLKISKESNLDIAIAGFDLPPDEFNNNWLFENISLMLEEVQKTNG